MALGAGRARILTWVVTDGARLTALGIAVGVVAALSMTHLLSSLLFGVEPSDPMTFVLVAGTLGAVGIAASYAPARRATKLDPMKVLRTD